jgi:hypothetical protein
MPQCKRLTNHYVGIDFDKGKFGLFEIAIADGYLKDIPQ